MDIALAPISTMTMQIQLYRVLLLKIKYQIILTSSMCYIDKFMYTIVFLIGSNSLWSNYIFIAVFYINLFSR